MVIMVATGANVAENTAVTHASCVVRDLVQDQNLDEFAFAKLVAAW